MSLEPSFEDREVLAETLRLAGSRMTTRERLADVLVGVGFVAAVGGLIVLRPPQGLNVWPTVVCIVVMALAMRVRFDTPLGFTVPTQLAFVPLLFAMPLALVPVGVLAALTLARVADLWRAPVRDRPLWSVVGNAWFAVGPVLVFVIAGRAPGDAGPGLLLAALGAQFVVDFAASAFRFAFERGATLVSQLRDVWVYGVDAALSPIGLLAATQLHSTPLAGLAVVPLLGLLAIFAHERHRRLESLLELSSAYRGTALVLGDVVEADDGYTGEHSRSVVGLAIALGETLGLSAERCRNLEFGALLHDVGKIAIPKEIINKPGKLDPEEWTLIKTHTIEGQRMLERVGGFMRDVGLIVRSHHERWDGTGYPDGLAGAAIPLEARIIACCDTWNAMRTDRSYRKALSYEVAITELLAISGTQLDPDLVRTLVDIVSATEGRKDEPARRSAPEPAPDSAPPRLAEPAAS